MFRSQVNLFTFEEIDKPYIKGMRSYVAFDLSPSAFQWVVDYPPLCDTEEYFYDTTDKICKRNTIVL